MLVVLLSALLMCGGHACVRALNMASREWVEWMRCLYRPVGHAVPGTEEFIVSRP